jgi:hypothetical protein
MNTFIFTLDRTKAVQFIIVEMRSNTKNTADRRMVPRRFHVLTFIWKRESSDNTSTVQPSLWYLEDGLLHLRYTLYGGIGKPVEPSLTSLS